MKILNKQLGKVKRYRSISKALIMDRNDICFQHSTCAPEFVKILSYFCFLFAEVSFLAKGCNLENIQRVGSGIFCIKLRQMIQYRIHLYLLMNVEVGLGARRSCGNYNTLSICARM